MIPHRSPRLAPSLLAVLVHLGLGLVHAPAAEAKVVCPGPDAVYGIDVSQWQGNIDWVKVKGAGKEFAIIRVSDGLNHIDPYFAQNWNGAKAAGVIRGVYQYFEPAQDAVQQANLLLQKMGPLGPGDLPPMIDVEADGGQSPAVITRKIHQWIDTVEAAIGRKPLIYTGGWFWNPKVNSGDFVSHPLVNAYYCNNCCPDIAAPWTEWAMWQYSSTGQVPGIAGNVDLDRFDGTLADLKKLAGGVDWAARYVNQSWPLAKSPLTMTVNQDLAASITLKNVGAKAWNKNTRLGTTVARDRNSAFAGPDWVGPTRAADCAAGAAPGVDCAFTFTWHAPAKPGEYHEFFTLVQEGVAWFSDPGQGGPADNVIEAWIKVVEADYHAQFVAQGFPLSPTAATARSGEELAGWIDLKNVGTMSWKAGVTKLAPIPRDKASGLAALDWLSPTRVSSVMADTPPGAVGRFPLTLQAGAPGDYTQGFGLVQEGVTWFADAPRGGGPDDKLLKVRMVVSPAVPPPDMAGGGKVDAGGPVVMDMSGGRVDLAGGQGGDMARGVPYGNLDLSRGGGAVDGGTSPGISLGGGCTMGGGHRVGVAGGGARGGPEGGLLALLLPSLMALAVRRGRRHPRTQA